jgi:hypothetical protein
MQAPPKSAWLRRRVIVLGSIFLTAILIVGAYAVLRAQRAERQAEVAARGSGVMPFDLERTTHIFEPRDDGGLQTVTADDPADAEQVRLIQEHLQAEAAQFQRGDFTDPASIHGASMPGLAALQAGAGRIQVTYTALPNGGQIRYTTADAGLISPLHAWFSAQLADHGPHASDHQMP